MKITVLDKPTFTVGDIDLAHIDTLGEVSYHGILSREEVVEACIDSPIVICNKTLFDRDMIERLPNLRYIGLTATGYNNVDLAFAKSRGIVVTNVPGYSTVDVAQHVFAMILHHSNQIHTYDLSVKRGDWISSKTFCYFDYPLAELDGKKLGIFGYGDIGKRVARIADAMGMRVLVHTRTTPSYMPYTLVDRDTLFGESDYLTLHCPLNDATHHLINDHTLSMMKPTAVLINTSRGPVVDELALASALKVGKISHAYLDVLSTEPMSSECPLIDVPNLTITPHIAWAPRESRQRLMDIVANNATAYMSGTPVNVVNK